MMSIGSRTWVCILYSCNAFFFFSSYHRLMHSFIYFACCSCHAVTDMPEESKAATGPTVPTALIPAGPSNFLTLVPSLIKTFVIVPTSFLRFLGKGLYCALNFLLGLSLAKVAPTSCFEIGSSFAAVLDLMSEVIAFFAHFEQVETNYLDPANF